MVGSRSATGGVGVGFCVGGMKVSSAGYGVSGVEMQRGQGRWILTKGT